MRALPAAVGGLALFLVVAAAWQQDWTYDEPYHLLWSERLIDQGVVERESHERLNSKTPVMVPNVLARKAATALGAESVRARRMAARAPGAAWLLVLVLAVGHLARVLAGPAAGALAMLLCLLDPNLIAHASLATVDAAFAATCTLTLAAVALLARSVRQERASASVVTRWALMLGLALGLAFAAKFTAVLLLPAALLWPWAARGAPVDARTWVRLTGSALAVAWVVVSSAYLFQGLLTPLRAHEWRSAPFTILAEALPALRLPAPVAFLTGLDLSLADERGEWNVYLLGQRYPRGVWHYFLVVGALKTPLTLVLAVLAGLGLAVRARLLHDRAVLFLGANLALFVVYFSFFFHAQIGIRYVLMCVPLVYLLASAGLVHLPRPGLAAAGVSALAVLETIAYLGNPLAFTTAAFWPKRHAYRLIADSNIDWGQNRDKVKEWIGSPREVALNPVHPLPGRNVVGLNALAGIWDFEQYRWLRENLEPGAHLGHTYLSYDLSEGDYERYLTEVRRLPPRSAGDTTCPESLPWALLAPGGRQPLVIDRNPRKGDTYLICVSTERGLDLGLRVMDGHVRFGHLDGEHCHARLVERGQSAWYRLDAGTHALCAEAIPNRRSWLDYSFEGRLVARGHSASVHVAPPRPGPSDQTSTSGSDQPSKLVPPDSTSSEIPVN